MGSTLTSADDDTGRTTDDGLVDRLRSSGRLGPFRVADWCGLTDVGLRRRRNEDRWAGDPSAGFVVADGMGGSPFGDLAAAAAVHAAMDELASLTEADARSFVDHVHATVDQAGSDAGTDRLGTTLAVLAARSTHAIVVHVGDSRVYRSRDRRLELLTEDHSLRNEMRSAGISPDDEGFSGVRLDGLTAYLGRRSGLPVPFRSATFSIRAGDRFLVCSDGIHGQLGDDDLADALAATNCSTAARLLVDRSIEAGGRDNATAIVVEFSAVDSDEPEAQ